jgi:hypothetical protein
VDTTTLRRTLSLVLDRLGPDWVDYRVVGTGSARLQGVDLPTGDIDMLVRRRADVDRFAAALGDYPVLTPPTWLDEARQYFTEFVVDGVRAGASTVEVPCDTDTAECIGDGPWTHHVDVAVGRHVVPTVALELRVASELIRKRPDRLRPLIDHLRRHGGDLELLRRSLDDRHIDPAVRREVLGQLESAA